MKQKEAPVRANAGMRHDLWFAEEGLYRVEVLGAGALALSLALPAVPAVALIALLGRGLGDYAVRECAALLAACIAAAYLVPTAVVRRRRRLLDVTFDQAKASPRAKKIPWDRVKRVVLTKRTTLRLELRRGRLTQVVRAGISQNDANRVKSIIVQSKAARGLEFRDGVLR